MKTNQLPKVIPLFLILLFQEKTFAQMGINATGTPPASNAMLDVSSTTKGVLMPRMTTAQRNALAHTQGLTVFDITTNNYWYSDGSAWIPITNAAAGTSWNLSGTHIFNNNTGNVGIGTTTPLHKLSVVTPTKVYGITHSDGNVTMGSWLTATTAQFGTKSNHPLEFFTNNGSAQMTVVQNGNVGIGTTIPAEKLTISGNVFTEGNASGFRFSDRAGLDNLKGYQWYSTGGSAYLYRHHAPIGNVISVLGNGNFGLNTSTPQTDFHINPGGAGSILIGTNKSAGGYTNLEMGITAQSNGQSFIQSTKASGSSYGTLQLNPSGGDVTVAGSLGIGTLSPLTKVHVDPNGAGSIFIGTNQMSSNNNLEIGISAKANGYSYIQARDGIFADEYNGNLQLNPQGGYVGINQPNVSKVKFPLDINQTEYGFGIRLLMTNTNNEDASWDIGNFGDLLYISYNDDAKVYFTKFGQLVTVSDSRLKKNITAKEDLLDKVLALKVKKYLYKDQNEGENLSLGLIAQEVLPLFPEIVSEFKYPKKDTTDTNIYHGINYAGFGVIAIKAIQEQQVIIESLRTENKTFSTEMDMLKADNKAILVKITKMQEAIEALSKK